MYNIMRFSAKASSHTSTTVRENKRNLSLLGYILYSQRAEAKLRLVKANQIFFALCDLFSIHVQVNKSYQLARTNLKFSTRNTQS